MPVFTAEGQQKQGADEDHGHGSPGVAGMEHADFPVGILGRNGGYHRGQKRFGKAASRGEDHGAYHDAGIGILGKEHGKQCKSRKAEDGDPGCSLDGFGNMESVREEGKQQIHAELGHIIDQNQKSQTGVRNAVEGTEGQKQHRGKVAHHRHSDVCDVTG